MARCEDCVMDATHSVFRDKRTGAMRVIGLRGIRWLEGMGGCVIPVRWCAWHAHVYMRLLNHPYPEETAHVPAP